MSRRAKNDARSGNPLAGQRKNQSRKFDKTTSVTVTFEDIAGLKAAKRDLQEVVQFPWCNRIASAPGGKVPGRSPDRAARHGKTRPWRGRWQARVSGLFI